MNMHFEASNTVTILFDFWDVHGPAGMVLSVFVVLLLTVVYELLKVWKIWLGENSLPSSAPLPQPFSPLESQGSSTALTSSLSESSLQPTKQSLPRPIHRWLLHSLQAFLHIIQVTLGYMIMLCVMTYNIWIFLGVVLGSVLGYFLGFPLLSQV